MRPLVRALALGSVAVGALGAAALPAHATTPRVHPSLARQPAPAATGVPGTFVRVAPFRAARPATALRAGTSRTVQLGGRGGVPARNVAAVAITLTVVAPTASGALVAYPAGGRRPAIADLAFERGTPASAAAISRVSPGGALVVYDRAPAGSTTFALDVSGYYVGGAASATQVKLPGVLHALHPATRGADTRSEGGPIGAGLTRTFALGGTGDMPASGIGAVAVSISVFGPTRTGGLIAYARGNDPPDVNTTMFAAGHSSTSFAMVPTDRSGRISVRNNSAGTVQVVLDIAAYTVFGASRTAGTLQPRFPQRLLGGARLGRGATVRVPVAGRAGVPLADVSAVVVDLAVATPRAAGTVTAWGGGAVPGVASVSFTAGRPAGGLAVVPVSNGAIQVHNSSPGPLTLTVAIVGFVPTNSITPPPTSRSHYIRNLRYDDTDQELRTKMAPLGAADAGNGSRLVVLEFGVQTNRATQGLGPDNPGVLQTGTDERLTYAQVVTAVQAYETGFGPGKVTIAVGTNNDGDWDSYPASDRGADWANDVVAPLRTASTPNFTVVGANDIEASFDPSDSSLLHAQQWEDGYFGANIDVELYMNGSLDNCPDAFDTTNATCTPGWTQDDYYDLATGHGEPDGRTAVLPQVYTVSQATQWVNVDRSGGGALAFAGALTEAASCPAASADCPTASYDGRNGWSALLRGLATLPGSQPVPEVTDLRIDR